jgi:phage shock protein A
MMGNGETGGERTIVVRTGGGIGFFGSMVLIGMGIAAGAWFMPNLGSITNFAQDLFRPTSVSAPTFRSTACEQTTFACLQARQRELLDADKRVEDAIAQLRPASEAVADLIRIHETRYAQNEILLIEGRSTLHRVDDPTMPVRFIGTIYPNREMLLRQMQVLWGERETMEQILSTAKTQREAIQRRYDALLVARSEVRSAASMLPAQLELARANDAMVLVTGTLSAIDGAMHSIEAPSRGLESLIRTTDELVRTGRARSTPQATAQDRSANSLDVFLQRRS